MKTSLFFFVIFFAGLVFAGEKLPDLSTGRIISSIAGVDSVVVEVIGEDNIRITFPKGKVIGAVFSQSRFGAGWTITQKISDGRYSAKIISSRFCAKPESWVVTRKNYYIVEIIY